MSRRIAQRPRYRAMRHLVRPSLRTRQEFFHHRWTYRRLALAYPKTIPGQGLLLIPFHRFVHSLRA
ncbi:MAG: hypothetical protein NVS4B7_07180 [Ktedonobacteraceae bacterium]